MVTRESLKVYDKAVVFAASAETLLAHWSKRYAVTEQFLRAAESIVLNLAEGARLSAGSLKATSLDYAIGSSLECAAALDIAPILAAQLDIASGRKLLTRITAMLSQF